VDARSPDLRGLATCASKGDEVVRVHRRGGRPRPSSRVASGKPEGVLSQPIGPAETRNALRQDPICERQRVRGDVARIVPSTSKQALGVRVVEPRQQIVANVDFQAPSLSPAPTSATSRGPGGRGRSFLSSPLSTCRVANDP